MVSNSTNRCVGCGRDILSTVSGLQCLHCLLDLADSNSDLNQGLVDIPTKESFLANGVLPQFGNYELVAEIARGGMGVVYRAFDRRLNRTVAVKMILAGQLATAESVQRFVVEAKAAARLDHPGIVPIYEIGDYETQHYFSMKLIDGGSLEARMSEFALPSSATAAESRQKQMEIAGIIRSIASAIHYAHAHGVLHRDIKPSNVLIDEAGNPFLTDFGLAKLTGNEAGGLTLTTAILGSPCYMAPEQALGSIEDVTVAADIYGLGATLYQLLANKVPFSGPTALATMKSVVEDLPRRPRSINSDIHPDLETIVLKCMEKAPSARYASADIVEEELKRFINGEPILARPVNALEHSLRWCQRNPFVAALLGGLAIVFLGGISGVIWQWQRAESTKVALQASLDRSQWEDLVQMTDREENSEVLAQLAHRLRRKPNDWRAAMLATSILDHRRFPRPRCPTITHGDKFEFTSATFDASGSRIATATTDGTARIWDSTTGKELFCLVHGDVVNQVTFLPGDDRILTASQDGTAAIWNSLNGDRLAVLPHQGSVAVAVGLSSDNLIATASTDGWVRIWDVSQPASIASIGGFDLGQPVVSLAASVPNGQLLLGGRDGAIATLDITEPTKPIAVWTVSVEGPLKSAAFSFDGQFVVATGKKVTCWKLAADEVVFEGGTYGEFLPALSQNDARIHTLVSAAATQVVDLATGVRIGDSIAHKYLCSASAFAPIGDWLAIGGWDYKVNILDTKDDFQAISPIHTNAIPRYLNFAPNNQSLLVVSGSSQFVTNAPAEGASIGVWDLTAKFSQQLFSSSSARPLWSAVSRDGKTFAVTNDKGAINFLDRELNLLRVCHPPGLSNYAHGLALTPDGSRLLIGDGNGNICCIDVSSGEVLWGPLKLGVRGYSYRLSHRGQLFAFAAHSGDVYLIDVSTGTLRGAVLHHGGQLNDVNFSSDDRLLTSASDDHTAKIFDVQTGKDLQTVHHTFRVEASKFSPDNRKLVTGSNDFSAQIWDVESGQPIGAPMKHRGEVTNAEFSSDGGKILTSARDGTARIWDAQTGLPLVPPMLHQTSIREANFSPNGRLVITVDHKCLQVWDAISGQPVGTRIHRVSSSGIGHDSCGARVPFLADSSAAFWAQTTKPAEIIDTTIPPTPVPDWFPLMLECIGGQRIGANDTPEDLTITELLETRRNWRNRNTKDADYYRRRLLLWLPERNEPK